MGRTSTITSRSSARSTDVSYETTTWKADHCLQPPGPAPTGPYKGVPSSISEACEKFRDVLRKSLRVIKTRGRPYEGDGGDEIGIEVEAIDRGALANLECAEEPSVARKRSTRKPNRPRGDSIQATTEGLASAPFPNTASNRPKEEPNPSLTSELATFMDVEDPFACHISGSPRIVKDPASALPLSVTNKVVEARRRVRRRTRRPGSAGRRPGSAGRRPGSAASNSGKARPRFEWRVGASPPNTPLRSVRLRPPTPRKPSTPKELRFPFQARATSMDSPGRSATSHHPASSSLPTPSQSFAVRKNPKPQVSVSAPSFARLFAPSRRREKPKLSASPPYPASSPPTPRPVARVSHTSFSSFTLASKSPKAARHSLNLRHYLPFMLPSNSCTIASSATPQFLAPSPSLTISDEFVLPPIPTTPPLTHEADHKGVRPIQLQYELLTVAQEVNE